MKLYESIVVPSQSTVRFVEINGERVGVIGTVSDLINLHTLDYSDFCESAWAFVPCKTRIFHGVFAHSRTDIINVITDMYKEN